MINRKVLALLAVALLGLVATIWWWNPGSFKTTTGPDNTAQTAAVSGALARQDSNTVAIITSNFARVQSYPAASAVPAAAGQPTPLQITNIPPEIVLQNVRRAVRQYGEMFGGDPVGTNPEITGQLSGDNPRHINFINADAGMRVDAAGELIDSWGTPFFFHQLSGSDMEIHSAGPDRILWTSDDLVYR